MKSLVMTAAMLLAIFLPQGCKASSNEYSLSRILNVAILRIPSAGQSGPSPSGALLAPYIFDILNNRPDIKPALWKLVNPLAPATVDSEISARYPNLYAIDQPVMPNMAPYWDLDLNKVASAATLTQYNLLVIRTSGIISLTIGQRQILRQYVDQGGTLWIDGSTDLQLRSTTFDPANNPFGNPNPKNYPDRTNPFRIQFGTVGAGLTATSYHPLASSPYALSSAAISALGYGVTPGRFQGRTLVSEATGGAPDISLFRQIGGSIYAGDYGSGHVIVDGLGIGDLINAQGQSLGIPGQANLTTANPALPVVAPTNPSPYDLTNYSGAPSADLQFLVNVLSYATASPNPGANVRGDGVQGGNISGALSGSWQSLFSDASDRPVGVATYGKFVYTTDSLGTLNCLDINPAESIFPDAIGGDDGTSDYSTGTSYDVIWSESLGGPLSPPVVATIPVASLGATSVVMVEEASGNVDVYQSDTDPGSPTAYVQPTPLFKLNGIGGTFTGTIPGPTYYRGEILVPQPNGSLSVFSPSSGGAFSTTTSNTAWNFGIPPGTGWVQPVAVASVPSTDDLGFNGDEIVGYAVFGNGVQTLELGSRDEGLKASGQVGGSTSTYETRAGTIGTTSGDSLIGPPEDTQSLPGDQNWVLDYNSADNNNNVFDFATTTQLAGTVTVGVQSETIYADYDLVLTGSISPTRSSILSATANGSGTGYRIAGAAVGPDNVVYMTVNAGPNGPAYIEATTEQAPVNAVSSIDWRFLLSGSYNTASQTYSLVDATGIGYDFFGYTFVGSPIVGSNGIVYALATNGTNSRLIAFNAAPSVGFASPYKMYTVVQTDEFGQPEPITDSQYDGSGHFTNFAPSGAAEGVLSPSLFAPGQVQITEEVFNGGTAQPTGPPVPVAINTAFDGNTPMLEWYTQIAGAATSAPRMVGDYIYFGVAGQTANSVGTIAVLANPDRIGLQPVPNSRLIADSADYRFVQDVPTRVGALVLAPAGSDKYLVTAGTNGFEGLAYNNVLIADSNRLIELDPDGNASWTMDATQLATTTTAAVASPGTGFTVPLSSTSVSLNRPSSVSQLSTNDYLIADTGNNRCVQADRSGNVLTQLVDGQGNVLTSTGNVPIPSSTTQQTVSSLGSALEITGFGDPLIIVPTGEPLTLNQPNAVVTWLTYEYPAPGINASYINVHYLVSDTGNSRLLDIVDRYTSIADAVTNLPTNQYYIANADDFHYVNWISHTSDIAARSYKYVSGEPVLNTGQTTGPVIQYPDNFQPGPSDVLINQATAIIGVVGDKRIFQLAAPGGQLPVTASNFPPVNQDSVGSSILLMNYSSGFAFSAATKTGLPFQLINSVIYGNSTSPISFPLRGLRSAVATSYTIGPPASFGSLVIADADGVFDGTVAAGTSTLDATYGGTTLGWSFVQADYVNMVSQYNLNQSALTPPVNGTSYQNYSGTNFVPASAIILSGNNYLIVNTGGSGSPGSPAQSGLADNGFGGNVFTVHAAKSATLGPQDLLDGPIYGHPANSGALSAPAFALRSN